MDPKDFHQLAVQLSASDSAASLRTATSRAYYAAFNISVKLLNQYVPLSKGPAAHGQVQRLLANSGHRDVAQAGSHLGVPHSRRIHAD